MQDEMAPNDLFNIDSLIKKKSDPPILFHFGMKPETYNCNVLPKFSPIQLYITFILNATPVLDKKPLKTV